MWRVYLIIGQIVYPITMKQLICGTGIKRKLLINGLVNAHYKF